VAYLKNVSGTKGGFLGTEEQNTIETIVEINA